ncbi:hypothetical protein JMA_28980 [Jeotgalibacillus malaysiensis]|uniref:GIY-YIG domain-containing protein n=1 Tax=Jeotgalibacillus malaysiensis TaxID=1508404 RepID=A0A0B5APP7_9BACL|nr:hypothetical protein [Jeotgalibacillus malaysiensis]AJD92215.1 hypothetical protein JMA_28980 [Jeotgalibacillus malaysiensis]
MIQTQHMIQIDWNGPYKLPELNQLTNTETDYGVYQIYGKHPVYGSNVLLYIGKADRQTFGIRISQEGWLYQNDANNLKIYIGRLHGNQPSSGSAWSSEIDLAERLLLYVHKPAHNSKSIASLVNQQLQYVHVLNWGHHRDLLPEVSGFRWTGRLDEEGYEVYRWE